MEYKDFEGPEVTWLKSKVKQIVDSVGEEEAIKLIADKVFTEEYVRETMKTLFMEGAGERLVSRRGFSRKTKICF